MLFEAVISELSEMNVVSLALPQDTSQDYESLSEYVAHHLPDEDFILVAESFSGGIAAALSRQDIPYLRGIIFVASFLSAPRQLPAHLCSLLPVSSLARLPLSGVIHRLLFLGWRASNSEICLFKRVIKSVPNHIFKARLKVIANCHYDGFTSPTPAVYIGASKDMLVPQSLQTHFKKAYPGIRINLIEGPHFLLQARPKAGAAAIIQAVHHLTGQGTQTHQS